MALHDPTSHFGSGGGNGETPHELYMHMIRAATLCFGMRADRSDAALVFSKSVLNRIGTIMRVGEDICPDCALLLCTTTLSATLAGQMSDLCSRFSQEYGQERAEHMFALLVEGLCDEIKNAYASMRLSIIEEKSNEG